MGWTNDQIDTLTLPTSATDGQPRLVIGPGIPAELAAFYAAPFNLVEAIVQYSSITNAYRYEGILDNTNAVVSGWVFGGVVIESRRSLVAGSGNVQEWWGPSGTAQRIDSIYEGTGMVHVQCDGGLAVAGGVPLAYAGTPLRVLFDSQIGRMNGAVQPVNAAAALLAGTALTVTAPMTACVIEAEATFDFAHATAGADTAVGELLIDGVPTTGQAIFAGNSSTGGLRDTAGQTWGPVSLGTFGAHTVQLRVSKAGGTDGHIVCNPTHTALRVRLYGVT